MNTHSFKLAVQVLELVVFTTIPYLLTSFKGNNIMSNLPKKSVISANSSKDKDIVNGYGNIKIKTKNKAGIEKLSSIGIYGLMLRDSNKVEHALLELARQGESIEDFELVMDITLLDETNEDEEIEFVTK